MPCRQLMARPKSYALGLLNTGLDIYSANKLRKMGSEFDSLRRSHEISTAITLDAISGIAELQTATMYGINQLSQQLTELSNISWSIANYFELKEAKEDFTGDLKMVLTKFEDELDYIDKISEEYTEYAELQVESLQSLVKENDVRIEHFKTLSFADIDKAEGILLRIERTQIILWKKRLEEGLLKRIGIKQLKHLEKSLSEISQKKLLLESLEKELTDAERRLSGIESAKSDIERNLKSISNIEQKIQDLRIEIQETYESIKHLIPYSNYL